MWCPICGAPNDAHAAPILAQLNLDSLMERRKLRIKDLVVKAIENKSKLSLTELFVMDNNGKIAIPSWRTLSGKRRFSVIAAKLFNEICESI